MARHLLGLGCNIGDVIVIFSPTSIECVIVTLAAWRIGAVVAGVSPLLTVGKIYNVFTNFLYHDVVLKFIQRNNS